jgi:hypothetical protein
VFPFADQFSFFHREIQTSGHWDPQRRSERWTSGLVLRLLSRLGARRGPVWRSHQARTDFEAAWWLLLPTKVDFQALCGSALKQRFMVQILKGHVMASVGPRSNPSILKRALMGFTTESVESLTRVVEKLHSITREGARFAAMKPWPIGINAYMSISPSSGHAQPAPSSASFGAKTSGR